MGVALGALRVTVLIDGWTTAPAAPLQVLAKLHAAAAAGLLPQDMLGRPRAGAAGGVAELAALMSPDRDGRTPAAGLLAAIAHAEVVMADAFAPVSTEVAFAFARGIARWGGLDPMGAALPEVHAATDAQGYRRSLDGYDGDPLAWCGWWLDALATGAGHGRLAADAVSRGRFDGT